MSEEKKTKKEQDKLSFKKTSAWVGLKNSEVNAIFSFSEEYKKFLKLSKTERETVSYIQTISKQKGFIDINKGKTTDKKLFYNHKNIACALVKINNLDFDKGFKILASHIDAPRIDLKPISLYEAEDLAFMKTHYYGGIKKYQWVTMPIAIHGVIVLENATKINISIGEDLSDPVFTINDLLPHLAQDQMAKTASKFIEGEQLNILVGSVPYRFKKGSNAVKHNILDILMKKYKIKEEDLISADLELVPAGEPRDVGFDRGLIGAYGQDDRVCAFAELKSIIESNSKDNIISIFFDKEEIGSTNSSGADSNFVLRLLNDVFNLYKVDTKYKLIKCLESSKAISIDVTAGIDPEWKSVSEPMNEAKLSYGVTLSKSGGSRGKSGASEASAEYFASLRNIFNKNKIKWYPSELGKVDVGGGGTVAKFLSYYGMDVIDMGVPLLSMHSPFEVSSKVDIYELYRALKVFLMC